MIIQLQTTTKLLTSSVTYSMPFLSTAKCKIIDTNSMLNWLHAEDYYSNIYNSSSLSQLSDIKLQTQKALCDKIRERCQWAFNEWLLRLCHPLKIMALSFTRFCLLKTLNSCPSYIKKNALILLHDSREYYALPINIQKTTTQVCL